jgi:hypothetical protein
MFAKICIESEGKVFEQIYEFDMEGLTFKEKFKRCLNRVFAEFEDEDTVNVTLPAKLNGTKAYISSHDCNGRLASHYLATLVTSFEVFDTIEAALSAKRLSECIRAVRRRDSKSNTDTDVLVELVKSELGASIDTESAPNGPYESYLKLHLDDILQDFSVGVLAILKEEVGTSMPSTARATVNAHKRIMDKLRDDLQAKGNVPASDHLRGTPLNNDLVLDYPCSIPVVDIEEKFAQMVTEMRECTPEHNVEIEAPSEPWWGPGEQSYTILSGDRQEPITISGFGLMDALRRAGLDETVLTKIKLVK